MRIRWTVPAADDLTNINNYLQKHYPQFAESTVRAIYEHVRSLKTMPDGSGPGMRRPVLILQSNPFNESAIADHVQSWFGPGARQRPTEPGPLRSVETFGRQRVAAFYGRQAALD